MDLGGVGVFCGVSCGGGYLCGVFGEVVLCGLIGEVALCGLGFFCVGGVFCGVFLGVVAGVDWYKGVLGILGFLWGRGVCLGVVWSFGGSWLGVVLGGACLLGSCWGVVPRGFSAWVGVVLLGVSLAGLFFSVVPGGGGLA